ncbi:hypothetical protein L1987_61087 [Smallanthus sonchifolius]|uniref:Uncharacterized protein n=1 Tax=Smallanthus sonchifolius TaxID=185202 RepID=A0ACB9DA84_9ASTR|nr:hypothetical protein L1987_61087 [Smallanthus sonchifolius]
MIFRKSEERESESWVGEEGFVRAKGASEDLTNGDRRSKILTADNFEFLVILLLRGKRGVIHLPKSSKQDFQHLRPSIQDSRSGRSAGIGYIGQQRPPVNGYSLTLSPMVDILLLVEKILTHDVYRPSCIHFSLLLGRALPSGCLSGFNDWPLDPLAGILSLGIEDTMESMVGYKYGVLLWSKTCTDVLLFCLFYGVIGHLHCYDVCVSCYSSSYVHCRVLTHVRHVISYHVVIACVVFFYVISIETRVYVISIGTRALFQMKFDS